MVPNLPEGCRPQDLCPDICDNEYDIKDQGNIEKNISAVEQYVAALGKKLIQNLKEIGLAEQRRLESQAAERRLGVSQKNKRKIKAKKIRIKKPDRKNKNKQGKPALEVAVEPGAPDSLLNANVLKNLEKVAAKDFQPNFIKDKGTQESFKSFIEHAKGRAEKYNFEKKEKKETEKFVEERSTQKEIKEPEHDKKEYQERVKARIAVYAGWEYKDSDIKDSFMLVNTSKNQEITVTKRENGSFSIKATKKPVTDETIGIMIELAHNVLRFSDNKNMQMNIKGVESDGVIANKFKQGLDIINKEKEEPQKLKYTVCKSPDKK